MLPKTLCMCELQEPGAMSGSRRVVAARSQTTMKYAAEDALALYAKSCSWNGPAGHVVPPAWAINQP